MSTRFFTSIAFGLAAMATTAHAAVAVKADFNGDGFADVATSIPYKDVAGVADAGAVQILYSDGQGGGLTAANDQILDRTNCPFSHGGDRFGAAMAAGDFNGDTFADLAIGIPFADVPGVKGKVQDAGAVLIVYGTEAGLVCTKGTAQFRFQDFLAIEDQSEVGDRFGSALVAANFDGDARVVTDRSGTVLNVIPFDDLAIGVPGEDIHGTDAGMVNVLYGSSTGISVSGDQVFSQGAGHGLAGAAVEPGQVGRLTEDRPFQRPELLRDGDQFGSALAAGNFNRDFNTVGGQPVAIDELAVGAPGENLGGKSDIGAVNIVYGSTRGLTAADDQFWSQHSPGILGGAEDGDRFGHALAAGDFDGDDTDDLAVSAPLEDIDSVADAGAVNVIFGKAGTGLDDDRNQLWHEDAVDVLGNVIGTAEGNDQFGFALVAADFNETGIDDVAIGVPGQAVTGKDNAGAVHVFYGSRPGGVFSNGGFRTDQQQHWHLDQSDFAGNSVAGTSQPNDSYGAALGAGDINGDNAADLVIGIFQKDVPLATALIPDAGAISVLYGGPLDGFGQSSEITAKGNQFLHQGATDASGNVVDGIPAAFDRFGSAVSHGAFVTGDGSRGEGDVQGQASARMMIDDDDDPGPDPDDDPPPPDPPSDPPGGDTPVGGGTWTTDVFYDAPTQNLHTMAHALRFFGRSVTTVVYTSGGLNLGNPMEISILFGTQRITQTYDNAAGNRLKYDFAAMEGGTRRENVTVTLTEQTAAGPQTYTIPWWVDLEPLYDITIGALTWEEIGNCDIGSPADPVILWRSPDGVGHEAELDPGFFVSSGFAVLREGFEGTWTEVGVSRGLTQPAVNWYDADLPGSKFGALPNPGEPLLPGVTRNVKWTDSEEDCSANLRYDIRYQLITYP